MEKRREGDKGVIERGGDSCCSSFSLVLVPRDSWSAPEIQRCHSFFDCW